MNKNYVVVFENGAEWHVNAASIDEAKMIAIEGVMQAAGFQSPEQVCAIREVYFIFK